MQPLRPQDLDLTSLGPCEITSPVLRLQEVGFVDDANRIRLEHRVGPRFTHLEAFSLEEAGPRRNIYFDPTKICAAVVTCGGLSPGLNNVIRSVYSELAYNYEVPRVLGVRDGFMGLNPQVGRPMVEMTPAFVDHIHDLGGTILGSSRGPQEPAVIVDTLVREGIDLLFCVGGDGTQRRALGVAQEVRRRGLRKAVVGIPKTIDNDIEFVSTSFGYYTALEKAQEVLRGAHVEARCAPNGIGLCKLMGRHSGYIAAGAALASQDANFVLIPEIPFRLEGEDGLLAALERRILQKNHALVVVAEGAGQHLFDHETAERDASGNVRFQDIGHYLREKFLDYFRSREIEVNLKYLDPSYFIRSVPANPSDRILSDQMARMAVHAGMAGKTDMLIGSIHNELVHAPIATAVAQKKQLDTSGDLWTAVMRSTGQPYW